MRRVFPFVMLFTSLALLITSCQKQDALTVSAGSGSDSKTNTFYGPEKKLGDGKARSFITISHAGVPVEYGIRMTARSMQGLPTDGNDHEANTVYLPLHPKVDDVTPFSFIMLNWNPHGHDPEIFYGAPHFDFHFYFSTSIEEQMGFISGAAMETAPEPGYLPADYISPATGIPMMGKHWIDKFSPELPPTLATFDKTFIYGSYAGKVIFYEPMITRSFLMQGDSNEFPIKQPMYYSPGGTYYPTTYRVYTDTKTGDITVSLANFVLR